MQMPPPGMPGVPRLAFQNGMPAGSPQGTPGVSPRPGYFGGGMTNGAPQGPPGPPGTMMQPPGGGGGMMQPPGMMMGSQPQPPADQMRRMSLGSQAMMQPPGANMPGFRTPSGNMIPNGPPSNSMPLGNMPGMPGMRPPGAYPSGPSSVGGMHIGMPTNVPPPSTNTGMLAGIPPPMPGRGPMQPPPMSNGMSLPPGPPMGGPPSMGGPPPSMPGMIRPPGGLMAPPGPPPIGGFNAANGPMSAPQQPGMQGGMLQPGMPPPPPFMGPPGPPGPMQGMQQQQQQHRSSGGAPKNRIDPSQMPRPASSPAQVIMFDTRMGGTHVLPPPAASRYVVRDRGNAGPRYLRASLNQVPFTNDLLNTCNIPFSLVVTPMALPDPQDDQIQVVDYNEGPIRCSRCKAYMNPFMRWTNGGKNFTCNFCGSSNQTPDWYYCPLGHDGRRRDAEDRPELCRGSVEFTATREYCIRPPMNPAHMFVIDASATAIQTGALATACSAVSRVLDSIPFPERTLVGIATFDSVLHFYAIRPGSTQPQMLVVSEVNDVFAPNSAPLLVPVSKHKEDLQALLKQLPDMLGGQQLAASCGGAAMEAAVAVLAPTGGKVHAFLAALPSTGMHQLKMRDNVMISDKDKLTVLASQDNTLKSSAAVAAESQVVIDIALMGQGYMDVASLSDLVAGTGGTLYQYTPFNPVMDHDQVLNDLKWNLIRPQAMEAVMRVRCSQGLDVQSYTGHFNRIPSSPTDVFFPAVDSDKSVVAHISLTEKLQVNSECYMQAALLYTTLDGQRRIRVHTLAMPVTDNILAIFKHADIDAYTCSLARKLAGMLPGATLETARETVTTSIVNTLHAYRKHCAGTQSTVQLILPETLKLLPLHGLALLKAAGLKDGAKPDERSAWCASMLSLPAARITPMLYPRLIAFHNVLAAGGVAEFGGVPHGLNASAASMEQGGVYLLENGRDAYLYLDRMIDPQLLQDLLGVSSYDELMHTPPQNALLLPRDNKASTEFHELLTQIRIQRSSFMRLRVARKGDPAEVAYFGGLVEDKSTAGPAYQDYLCQVHRMIQDKVKS